MANNIADFMRREPGVGRNRHIVKPKFGFMAGSRNVNVRGFIALIRIKEGAIGSPAQNRRHVTPHPPSLRSGTLSREGRGKAPLTRSLRSRPLPASGVR